MIFCARSVRKLKTALRSFGVPDAYALAGKLREGEAAAEAASKALARAKEQEAAAAALLESENRLAAEKRNLLDAEARRLCGEEKDDQAVFALVEAYIAETEDLRRRQTSCMEQKGTAACRNEGVRPCCGGRKSFPPRGTSASLKNWILPNTAVGGIFAKMRSPRWE